MVIKASNADSIDRLVADLDSDRVAAREAASARLAVIGARTVEKLRALIQAADGSAVARVGALRALGAIRDSRALRVALDSVDDPDTAVAVAAIGATRLFLRGPKSVAILERLTELTLDRARAAAVRLAAFEVLDSLAPKTVRPLREALRDDPVPEIRYLAGGEPSGPHPSDLDLLRHAADVELPSDPALLLHALSRKGTEVEVTQLHRLVERVREQAQPQDPTSDEWSRVRAAAHTALAERGSRLGLYDIREWLERADAPLPVEFLRALRAIGDTTCLDSIAGAHTRIDDRWWQEHLVDVFSTIVERNHLTRRHAAIRKLERRWPSAFIHLWRR